MVPEYPTTYQSLSLRVDSAGIIHTVFNGTKNPIQEGVISCDKKEAGEYDIHFPNIFDPTLKETDMILTCAGNTANFNYSAKQNVSAYKVVNESIIRVLIEDDTGKNVSGSFSLEMKW